MHSNSSAVHYVCIPVSCTGQGSWVRRFTPLASDRSGDRAGSSLMERFLANVYIDVSDGSEKMMYVHRVSAMELSLHCTWRDLLGKTRTP